MIIFTNLLLLASSSLAVASSNSNHARLHHEHVEKRLFFDPMTEPIDVTGEHKFQPPTARDQRGPCPGLNALANHGYISRDGIASLGEVIPAINQIYGMGIDLGTLLSTMGVVWGGAPISLDPKFSIGSNDTAVSNLLGDLLGILGDPQGLDQTHNLIESDSSPTRDDLYVTGDAWTMNMKKFKAMLDALPEDKIMNSTFEPMADFAAQRFHESVASNPNFFYGPVTGLVARNAGYLFMSRMLSNHSSEHPDGTLNHDILKSFFGVQGDGANMTYNKGWERIPENWYRTPVDYGLVQLNLDAVAWVIRHPILGSIGGNTGETDSFVGLDLSDPVSGLANVPELLESNNLICFVLQIIKLAAPTYTNNLFTTLLKPLDFLLDALSAPLLDLSCPSTDALTKGGKPIWEELSERFPGAKSRAL